MRLLLVLLGTLLAHVTIPPSPTAGTLVRLQARHIAFYYDRYLIEADGRVHVTTSDGTMISGDAFSMDLRLNRFLVAGHVHLRSKSGNLDGAGIADFLGFHRVYFVPVVTRPDRWTYVDGNYASPIKGRQMPGDTFYFPDTSSSTISLTATSATIGERSFVRFGDVVTYAGSLRMPLPSYYFYFGTNRNLAINSLSGANFDETWNATGNGNAITSLHLRYDSANKAYLSGEQHFASDRSYAVISDNPATKQEHFWNLVGSDKIGSHFQFNLFTQLEETQSWFKQPESATLVSYATATQAFNQSFLSLAGTFVNYNLVNDAYFDHPSSLQLSATTVNHQIWKTPFYENITYGIGFNHDSLTPHGPAVFAQQEYGGVWYTTIWNHDLGYTLYLPGFQFGDHDDQYRRYYFNATLSVSRTWDSVPHHINSANSTFSVSRTFSRQVNSSLTYNIVNTSDIYNEGGYSPPASPPEGPYGPDTNFLAFRGASTLRAATLSTTYSANPNLVTTLSYMHRDDFPAAIPGIFAPPPLNNLGQYIYNNWFGQPPDQLTGEVRARLFPHVVIDIQRTDYFDFGDLKWSPQFIVQFSQ